MDPRSFDAISRKLAPRLPRRRALALLAGGVAPLLVNAPPPARAGCNKVGKKCDKNKDCCDGAKCKKDQRVCKAGRQECGGKCYHLDRDEKHCGACNIQCVEVEGEICDNGRCVNVPS